MKRLLSVVRSKAVGAMVAQVWQAAGSFGLQLGAAWLLGVEGLGRFSLCFGVVVVVTALTSGMIGDSLVILDRADRRVRGGLQLWTLVVAGAAFGASLLAFPAAGVLSPVEAALLGCALVAFQLEELVRRLLMATMRFWHLVVVDSCAMLGMLVVLLAWAAAGRVQLATFFVALAVGQCVGIAVGVALLPAHERALVSLRGADARTVASFGVLRGLQVSVPSLVLTAMRVVVTATAGAAALGALELARIYVAPALLSVQGLGSYLLSTYVRDSQLPLTQVRRRAGRSALLLVAAAVVAGGLLVALAPVVAAHVSGPRLGVDRAVMLGWVLYVAASASCQPFASLAATRGRQRTVLLCRLADASLTVLALALVLGLKGPTSSTPFVLAAGLFIGGLLVRTFALRSEPERLATGVSANKPTPTLVSRAGS